MKKLFLLLFSMMIFASTTLTAHAENVPFPTGWETWPEMETRLSSVAALPSCEADVALLPPIYQMVVETYCVLKLGGPGKVDVLVRPEAQKSYETRNGKFPDGVNMILRFRGVHLLLVTAHEKGQPKYAVYSEEGENVTQPRGPLSVETCTNCHTGFQAYCINGQCGQKR